jgi:uncharacterized protein YecE (DUF72 family)
VREHWFIGSAGWNIPRAHAERFPREGSQLQRYADRLTAVEINSSFYRPHKPETYRRWSDAVPPGFRFSVKIPKSITHDRQLSRVREPLARFLGEIAGLGGKLGPLLLQLPPKFVFDARRVGRFLERLRHAHAGGIACEPRHATWTSAAAVRLLESFSVARVAADPPRADGLSEPAAWGGLIYYRMHGSPRAYFSPYSADRIADLADRLARCDVPAWCIFDNTGSGSAAGNALDLIDALRDRAARAAASPARPRRSPARRTRA